MASRAVRDAHRMARRYAEDLLEDLESWKKDHDTALKCRDLEEGLAVLNGLFGLLLDLYWRYEGCALAAPGELNHDPEFDQCMEHWFDQFAESCLRLDNRIGFFEKQDYRVTGSEEFRSHFKAIEAIRREAREVARIEGRMGFRGVQMDPATANDFRALLDRHESSGSAPLSPVG